MMKYVLCPLAINCHHFCIRLVLCKCEADNIHKKKKQAENIPQGEVTFQPEEMNISCKKRARRMTMTKWQINRLII